MGVDESGKQSQTLAVDLLSVVAGQTPYISVHAHRKDPAYGHRHRLSAGSSSVRGYYFGVYNDQVGFLLHLLRISPGLFWV